MSDKINKTPLCACVIYNKNNPNNKNINEKAFRFSRILATSLFICLIIKHPIE